MDGPAFYASAGAARSVERLAEMVRKQHDLIAFQQSQATFCIAYPSCGLFLRKPFINFSAFGIPSRVNRDNADACTGSHNEQATALAVHAPSHELVKGTEKIVSIVTALNKRGVDIELRILSGEPHESVLAALADCDFVIDQLYNDIALGALGVEAAHLGKPTVLGGYFAERIRDFVREEDIPPSAYVPPDDLEKAIERLALDSQERARMGDEARTFVKNRWSPSKVGLEFVELIEGRGDPELWCDPQTLDYVLGCGIARHDCIENIRALVEAFGESALMLDDKPLALAAALALLKD